MNKCAKCGKIFVPIPGDDRDESFCLRCERNVLKAELERANREHEKLTEALSEDLERVQKQFGGCSVCGYVAWKDKDRTTEECQFCKLKKQAAEMKDTLMLVWGLTWESLSMSRADYMQILKRVEACKSIEFGQGYLSPAEMRDVVKPLVEALKRFAACNPTGLASIPRNRIFLWKPSQTSQDLPGISLADIDHAKVALEHAKAKGWL